MERYLKTYKFEMYPNAIQKHFLSCQFGACRMIYNKILEQVLPSYIEWDNERKEFYKDKANKDKKFYEIKEKPPVTRNAINAKDTNVSSVADLKKEFTFLKEYDSIALNMVVDHIESAFKAYENPNIPDAGLPRYKKRSGYQSFTTRRKANDLYNIMDGNIKVDVENQKILLPKFDKVWNGEKPGWMKLVMHRNIVIEDNPCQVKSVTVSLTPEGKYYASILVEYMKNPYEELEDTKKDVGVSFAIAKNSLVLATDDGYKFLKEADLERLRRIDVHIEDLQAKRSRMRGDNRKEGVTASNNYKKITLKINKLLAHKSRIIEYAQHCASKQLMKDYDTIYVRDFNSKEFIEKKKAENPDMTNDDVAYLNTMAKDNAIGNLILKLEYKAQAYNRVLYKIDKNYPCSKTCSNCGEIVEDRGDLDDKKWTCPHCMTEHVLYVNSAKNILNKGRGIEVTPEEYKKQLAKEKKDRSNVAKRFKNRIYEVLALYNENKEEPLRMNKGKINSMSKVLDPDSSDEEIIEYIKRMTSNKKRSHIKK